MAAFWSDVTTNSGDVTQVKVDCSNKIGNMITHGHCSVKHNTQIADGRGLRNDAATNVNAEVSEIFQIESR